MNQIVTKQSSKSRAARFDTRKLERRAVSQNILCALLFFLSTQCLRFQLKIMCFSDQQL
jgi:hypothetical protein